MRRIAVWLLTGIFLASPAYAQDRDVIGYGRLLSNDNIGDGNDRWRTGGYVLSQVRAPMPYDGKLQGFGDILEYRLRAEIIATTRDASAPGDRPYVGALSVGAHTHFGFGAADVSVGADLVAVGAQTRLANFQESFHQAFGLQDPATDNQVDDGFFVGGTAALSHTFRVSERVSIRPFAEAQVGVEDLVRVGGDVLIGQVGQNDLMLRDVVTGQLYRGTQNEADRGFSYLFGADIAAVAGSVFLPEEDGYVASDTRARVRTGVHYQMDDDVSFFYGMTYLSEEAEGQTEGQVLGSLKLNFNF